ncbi:MAG: [FeFe] hydrogenase H-cluster radical SAM maturase HydE [Clostridiales bacterium]|nr:[FeFe] hydrogenase H-cluster radical SAM maturase HydE [Clostridiales bacterium]
MSKTPEIFNIIDKLYASASLTRQELRFLLDNRDGASDERLFERARAVSARAFGKGVFLRGLIEFSNYCAKNCLYCGIRAGNAGAARYRLNKEEILKCCENGYSLGFRTFVLQSGEDPSFSDEALLPLVSEIRRTFPDCAITLSLGERSRESFEALFAAGANRYLLRHETASEAHYAKLHPPETRLPSRMGCLRELKRIGYQVGCGFMVGSPYQTNDDLVTDLLFIKDFAPQMVGIGPFIPHRDTPFAAFPPGGLEITLFAVAVTRLLLPEVLLPATTALGTIHPKGRERGVLAGANVVMPNLSPLENREKYSLYDGKICTGDEAAECIGCLGRRLSAVGYELSFARGDAAGFAAD